MYSPEVQRLNTMFELTEMLIKLNIAVDAKDHPEKSETELRRRFVRRMRSVKDRR